MSRVRFVATTTGVVTTGTSKKTVLQILAATDHRALVDEIEVSFGGTDSTGEPILVEVLRQSDAGTDGDPITPEKLDASDDETLEVTGLENIDGTTQPTDSAVLAEARVHPQAGYFWQAPYGKEYLVKGGGRLGIAVTAGADVEVAVTVKGEE